MQISAEEYLNGVYRLWEGDFDYADDALQRHDWGDFSHSDMHGKLMHWFVDRKKE